MGTLASVLAKSKIQTTESHYRAEVEGDIENVDGILKITQIRVKYHLKVSHEKAKEAREAFPQYLDLCPAAQTVKNCIKIQDDLLIEEIS